MPVSTQIFPTVGPTEGVSVFGGQGVGLRRSGCRSATAYARERVVLSMGGLLFHDGQHFLGVLPIVETRFLFAKDLALVQL